MNYEKTVSQDDVPMDIMQEQEGKTVSMKKEEFEYLFIDMEWNQREGTQDIQNREPIQIGLIGTDENLENIKLFSKYIRLEDVTALKAEDGELQY